VTQGRNFLCQIAVTAGTGVGGVAALFSGGGGDDGFITVSTDSAAEGAEALLPAVGAGHGAYGADHVHIIVLTVAAAKITGSIHPLMGAVVAAHRAVAVHIIDMVAGFLCMDGGGDHTQRQTKNQQNTE
jgi:hypothetical protein